MRKEYKNDTASFSLDAAKNVCVYILSREVSVDLSGVLSFSDKTQRTNEKLEV